jgi:hypothetical protein
MHTELLAQRVWDTTRVGLDALDALCEEINTKSGCCTLHMEAGHEANQLIDKMATSIVGRVFDRLFTMCVDEMEEEDLAPILKGLEEEFKVLCAKVQRDILDGIQRNSGTLH